MGTVKHEAALLPVQNAAYRKLMEERTQASLKPKATITFVEGVINPNLHAPGTVGAGASAGSTFAQFIVSTMPL